MTTRAASLLALAFATHVLTGCLAASSGEHAIDEEGPSDEIDDELRNTEKTGKPSSQWIYSGLLPALDDPSVDVSLSAHTVRVTGLLPVGWSGTLPFYVNRGPVVGGQQSIFVVYPVATGAIDPVTGRAPAGPGVYAGLRISPFVPTTSKAAWGGFPFMAYHRGRGLAFHGPITSVPGGDDPRDLEWRLKRGPVSHGCQRMQGEHVVEMAHLLGVDMTRPHRSSELVNDTTFKVTIKSGFDTAPDGKLVDVDYPALTGVKRPKGTSAKVYPTWDSRDFPNWVCAYDSKRPLKRGYCDFAGAPRRDAVTGAKLATEAPSPFVGSACTSDAQCGFTVSGAKGTCKKGSGGGYCTIPCAGYCPDAAGHAPTFCAADATGGSCAAKAHDVNDDCRALPGTIATQVDRHVGASGAKAARATVCALR